MLNPCSLTSYRGCGTALLQQLCAPGTCTTAPLTLLSDPLCSPLPLQDLWRDFLADFVLQVRQGQRLLWLMAAAADLPRHCHITAPSLPHGGCNRLTVCCGGK